MKHLIRGPAWVVLALVACEGESMRPVHDAGTGGSSPADSSADVARDATHEDAPEEASGGFAGIPADAGSEDVFQEDSGGFAGAADSGSDQDAADDSDAGTVSLVIDAGLPPARLNADYSFRLMAHGGTWPYRFTIAGGSLPPGFTLSENGRISGRAEGEGTFEFQVMAKDSANGLGVQSLSLTLTSQRWVALQPYWRYSDWLVPTDTRNFTIYLLDTATFAQTEVSSTAETSGGQDRVAEGFSPAGAYFVYRDLDKHRIRDTSGPAFGDPIDIGDWAMSDFSPDSRWLARLSQGELILARSSTASSKTHILAAGCAKMQWAQDGSKLSYACNGSLYVVEPDAPAQVARRFADGAALGWISPDIYAFVNQSGKLGFAEFLLTGTTLDELDTAASSLELQRTAEDRAIFHDTARNRDVFVDFATKSTHEQIAAGYSPHLKFFARWRNDSPGTTLDVFSLKPIADAPVASVAASVLIAWSPTDTVLATRISGVVTPDAFIDTATQFTFLEPPRVTQQFPDIYQAEPVPEVTFGKAERWAVLGGVYRHSMSATLLDRTSNTLIEVPGPCCELPGVSPTGEFVVYKGGGDTFLVPVNADGFGTPTSAHAYNSHYGSYTPRQWWTADSRYLLMESDGVGDPEVTGTLPRALNILDTSNPASSVEVVYAFDGRALHEHNDVVQVQP